MGTRTGIPDDALRSTPEVRPAGAVRDTVQTLLVCLVIVLFLRTFVVQQSDVPSGSMEDTILVGDFLLVNRFLHAPVSFDWERAVLPIRPIRRGEVVVFKHPHEPEWDYVKRVIGLPGDVVEFHGGRLFVNGKVIEEPYVNPLYRTFDPVGPLRVKPDEYFVMGDHRNNSRDSRAWGTVPRHLVRGRAFVVLFSTDAPPPADHTPGKVTVTSVLRKPVDLVFHSRWDRALRWIR